MAKKPRKKSRNKSPTKIEFHLIKSNYFRVVRGDGVFGGLTPQGAISTSFFSERQPLPRKIVHALSGGIPGSEIEAERDTRKGIIREVEVAVIMDMNVAVSFHQWLGAKIVELQTALASMEELQTAAIEAQKPRRTKRKKATAKVKFDDTLH